ncbi:alpha/beta fold hydrolase [Novosphingobium taihuense]|uniref:Palmitoyl-protein thioesterase ABHD10, mitochondrial n=1 Tax=Novosphingobium taihuense TaxID=260085 RepID=A0A7W7ACU8_9SPHN|nr:alpha/beta hydrolase [Novosphingobium taihuense]MBB4614693.1 pimeloyl-ACP methyl ester carboxylesterase [Novosphingobium taihuense]TWH86065.1 alpha/beta hydrolase family protein [Novosphingobium taihuense]
MTDVARFTLPSGKAMAYRHLPGQSPTIVFLPGYMSDMSGSKAQAVLDWAQDQGRSCLLLDYTGCGQSDGDFADGRLSQWRDEVVALLDHLGIGPVQLVGSSMGGWLMLLIAEALGERATALVGIAPAPDFTEWGLSQSQRIELAAGRTIYEDNPYGPEPTPTHAGFFSDGERHKRLRSGVAFDGPVRLIHGQADPDVPWDISIQLAGALRSADVQVHLIKDGDHRLSRPADIALLLRELAGLHAA